MRFCPIGNDIPQLLRLIAQKNWEKAVSLVGHPFGEICGYVCPREQHCQGGCVLSRRNNAIAIGDIERYAFSLYKYKAERQSDAAVGCKVAVIGGGVAGLTFAVKMYEQGADIVLYEQNELLSTLKLIPEFRLPRSAIESVEQAVDGKFPIVKQRVDAQKLCFLAETCDAVFVSTGTTVEYGLGIDGEELSTPYSVFLSRQADAICKGGRIAVIGGGNTAMDCARLAKRFGADVTVYYRRAREDMPAFDAEVSDAEKEGVKFCFNVTPVKLQQTNDLELVLAKTISQGRGKLIVGDETFSVSCDETVSAIGAHFDNSIMEMAEKTDMLHPTNNIFMGGDAAGGKTVAQAVADGMKTAKNIIDKLRHGR